MKKITPTKSATPSLSAWEKTVAFHGHACPGLAVGCRMALAGMEALGKDTSFLVKEQGSATNNTFASAPAFSPDEELVCVTETDACGVDAVQCLLCCTMGKGNLILKLRGKSAMSFYDREARKAVRVLWVAPKRDEDRQSTMQRFLSAPSEELMDIREIPFDPPARAVISKSVPCTGCGEITSEALVSCENGQPYCLDCRPR